MAERASIFSEDDDLDLSEFETAPARKVSAPAVKQAIREVAEQKGFVSRDPEPRRAPEPAPQPVPISSVMPRRRYTTGRNRQLNMKVTEEALRRFYALADAQGWVLGEAFEHAVTALERETQAAAPSKARR